MPLEREILWGLISIYITADLGLKAWCAVNIMKLNARISIIEAKHETIDNEQLRKLLIDRGIVC